MTHFVDNNLISVLTKAASFAAYPVALLTTDDASFATVLRNSQIEDYIMNEIIKQRIDTVHRGKVPEEYKRSDAGVMPTEWMEIKLGTIIEFYGEKSKKDNEYPVLTSARSGLVLQTDYFDGQVTREDNTGYNIIPYGYVTYRSRSDDGRFTFNQNKIIEKGIVSCFYPYFHHP